MLNEIIDRSGIKSLPYNDLIVLAMNDKTPPSTLSILTEINHFPLLLALVLNNNILADDLAKIEKQTRLDRKFDGIDVGDYYTHRVNEAARILIRQQLTKHPSITNRTLYRMLRVNDEAKLPAYDVLKSRNEHSFVLHRWIVTFWCLMMVSFAHPMHRRMVIDIAIGLVCYLLVLIFVFRN